MSKLRNIAESLAKSEMREAIHGAVSEHVKRCLGRDSVKKEIATLVELALKEAILEIVKETQAYQAQDVPPTPVNI